MLPYALAIIVTVAVFYVGRWYGRGEGIGYGVAHQAAKINGALWGLLHHVRSLLPRNPEAAHWVKPMDEELDRLETTTREHFGPPPTEGG